jgi:hypothetical protein
LHIFKSKKWARRRKKITCQPKRGNRKRSRQTWKKLNTLPSTTLMMMKRPHQCCIRNIIKRKMKVSWISLMMKAIMLNRNQTIKRACRKKKLLKNRRK